MKNIANKIRIIGLLVGLIGSVSFLTTYGIIATRSMINTEIDVLHENEFDTIVVDGYLESYDHLALGPSYYLFISDRQRTAFREFSSQEELVYINKQFSIFLGPTEFVIFFDYKKNIPDLGGFEGESFYEHKQILRFDGFIELDENQTALKLEKDKRLDASTPCHLPQNDDEIAISDMKADFFLKYGYKDDMKNIIPISDVNELIGKTLSGFKITGIYTYLDEPLSKVKEISDIMESTPNTTFVSFNSTSCLNNYGLMKKGTFSRFYDEIKRASEKIYPSLLFKLDKDISRNKEFFKSIEYRSHVYEVTGYTFENMDYHYYARPNTLYTELVRYQFYWSKHQAFKYLIIGIIFALLFVVFGISILKKRKKKKEG